MILTAFAFTRQKPRLEILHSSQILGWFGKSADKLSTIALMDLSMLFGVVLFRLMVIIKAWKDKK